MSPQEHVVRFEKAILDGDIAAMAESIGELHTQWDSLSPAVQADIRKLEAIFLSMLNARVQSRSAP